MAQRVRTLSRPDRSPLPHNAAWQANRPAITRSGKCSHDDSAPGCHRRHRDEDQLPQLPGRWLLFNIWSRRIIYFIGVTKAMPTTVRFQGRLQGDGREALCSGWCTRVTHIDGSVAFCDFRIDDEAVSPRVSDGSYKLLTDNNTTKVTRLNGRWLID